MRREARDASRLTEVLGALQPALVCASQHLGGTPPARPEGARRTLKSDETSGVAMPVARA